MQLGACSSEILPGPWTSGGCWLDPWGPIMAALTLTLQALSGLPGGGIPLLQGVSEEQARSSVLLPQETPGGGA